MLTRWHPLNRLHEEVNGMLDLFGVKEGRGSQAQGRYPALNLWEDGDVLFVEAELPGMRLEDLEIYVSEGNRLSIKGERKEPELGEKGTWHHRELGFGTFARELILPIDVDSEKVEARLAHGILTIQLPKSEAVKPRKITVKAD